MRLGTYTDVVDRDTAPPVLAADSELAAHLDKPWLRAYLSRHCNLPLTSPTDRKRRTGSASVSEEALARHIFLCGATGSGKSRLLRHLLAEHASARCSVVLIDPKGDTCDTF